MRIRSGVAVSSLVALVALSCSGAANSRYETKESEIDQDFRFKLVIAGQPIRVIALVGRDVLADMTMLYEGRHGRFCLTWD